MEGRSFLSVKDDHKMDNNKAELEQSPMMATWDPKTDKAICSFILATMQLDPEALKLVHLRIIRDIWHLFHQFPISLHHSLHCPFVQALSAAIYPQDKQAVKSTLEHKVLATKQS